MNVTRQAIYITVADLLGYLMKKPYAMENFMTKDTFISFETNGTTLIVKDQNGNSIEYKVPTRTLHLQVKNISISYSLSDTDTQSDLLPSLCGAATLMDSKGISVIGIPNTNSKSISISFYEQQEPPKTTDSGDNTKQATLSYTESDWEVELSSEWWIEAYIPSNQFKKLVDLIEKDRITNIYIGLQSTDLYVRITDFHAPPSIPVEWFLKPAEHSAELALCNINLLHINTKQIELTKTEPAENEFIS